MRHMEEAGGLIAELHQTQASGEALATDGALGVLRITGYGNCGLMLQFMYCITYFHES